MGDKVQGIRSINSKHTIDRGKVKNSIGYWEAKEVICRTHGHKLKGRNAGGRGVVGRRGIKGKKWDNCHSIINKIIF